MDNNDPTGFKSTRRRTDLSQGISLRDAILYYGDLESPEKLYGAHVLTSSAGILESVRCVLDSNALLSKYNQSAYNPRSKVMAKLLSGQLLGTGMRSGAPLAAAPEKIHPDVWRILVPDFNASSARLPTGELILGIRVFPGPFGNAAAAAPVGNQETLRTGFAGRPSSRHLLEAEMKRRAKVGDLKSSLREEARELADWLRLMHPKFPPATANTIRNSLADLYRELRAAAHHEYSAGCTKLSEPP
jgi:hypothetical protein